MLALIYENWLIRPQRLDPELAKRSAILALKELVGLLPVDSGYPTLLLSFDEADTCQVPLRNDPGKHRKNYSALMYAIDNLKTQPLFAIFMSTSSNLSQLAPPQSIHSSDRVMANDTIHAPFCEMPFDILAVPIAPSTKTLNETLTIEHLVQFGRPL
jgi:hypothetical protein